MKKHGEEFKKKAYDQIVQPVDQINKFLIDMDISTYSHETLETKLQEAEKQIKIIRQKISQNSGFHDKISRLVTVDQAYCKKHIIGFTYDHESCDDGMEYGNSSGNFSITYQHKNIDDVTTVTITGEYQSYGRYCDGGGNQEIKMKSNRWTGVDFYLTADEFFIQEDDDDIESYRDNSLYLGFLICSSYENNISGLC